jgi:hypothetical protein
MRSNAPRLLPGFREFQRRNGAPSHYRHLAITSRSPPRCRPGPADAATPGTTQHGHAACAHRSTVRAGRRANTADRADDLSALSPGADDLHPSADPPAGHGAMIHGTAHHSCSVWLSRVSSRRGDPLSPTHFVALVLTQTMTTTIVNLPSPTAMLRLCPAGRDG